MTPSLAVADEVFPVVGDHVSFGDGYGSFRSDVAGRWHHGDDLFAPLGTPVVAVADGTINRVGWNGVGGWRLWLRDHGGDEFYYAHLSGYARGDLRKRRVRAGDVIGFVGNTGDAFTTAPHLHFEIHPRTLLHLGYNGAVDPTSYVSRWRRLEHVRAPRPAHPPLPRSPAMRAEASRVWRELLSARRLERRPPVEGRRLPVPLRTIGWTDLVRSPRPTDASAVRAHGADGPSPGLFLLVVLPAAALAGLAAGVRSRRRRSAVC